MSSFIFFFQSLILFFFFLTSHLTHALLALSSPSPFHIPTYCGKLNNSPHPLHPPQTNPTKKIPHLKIRHFKILSQEKWDREARKEPCMQCQQADFQVETGDKLHTTVRDVGKRWWKGRRRKGGNMGERGSGMRKHANWNRTAWRKMTQND